MNKLKYDYSEIQSFYNEGHTRDECCKMFGISPSGYDRAVRKGLIVTRSISESQKISKGRFLRRHTDVTKQKLREAMLERRANGYDWTLAHSKTNGISHPESFFMEVIANEFEDKNYVFQHPLGRFAIDFAWVDKKLAIEIDGEQHYTDPEQVERDLRKNALLEQEGWSLLRIRWKDFFRDTKTNIQIAKNFVDG